MLCTPGKSQNLEINSAEEVFPLVKNTSLSSSRPKRIICELHKLETKCCPEEEGESYTPTLLSSMEVGEWSTEIKDEEEEKKSELKRGSSASTTTSIFPSRSNANNLETQSEEDEVKDIGLRAFPNSYNNKAPHRLLSKLEEIKEEEQLNNSSPSSSSSFSSSFDSEFSWKEHYPNITEYTDPQFITLLALKSKIYSLDRIIHKYSLKEEVIEHTNCMKDPAIERKTILLDLDLTLIQSYFDDILPPVGSAVPLIMVNPIFNIVVRKGARKFVQELEKYCEIILYSSGTATYVQEIINSVSEFKLNIKYVFSRDDCQIVKEAKETYLKSAKIIENRDPKNIIVVDDSFWAYPEDLDNVVPVKPFVVKEYNTDTELEELLLYILFLLEQADVRYSLRKKYGLQKQFDHKFRLLGGYD